MAYQRWFKTVRDQQGNAINGASCTVYGVGTSTLATVYDPNSDDASPSPQANPFTTTSNGRFGFMAADGEYDVQISGGSLATQQFRVSLNTLGQSASQLQSDLAANTGAGLVGFDPDASYASGTVGKNLTSLSSSGRTANDPASTITKTTTDDTLPNITMLLRNTQDSGSGTDYDNEVHLRLQAGSTESHRAYVNFANYDGVDKWVTGRNAQSCWILYNSETNHRIWMDPGASGPDPSYRTGGTFINSAESGKVRINWHLSDRTGLGGFEVWSGGYNGGGAGGTNNSKLMWVSADAEPVRCSDVSTSGTVLTVNAAPEGTLAVGMTVKISGVGSGVYISSLGTGTGGTGTYNLSESVATLSNVLGVFYSAQVVVYSAKNASSGSGAIVCYGGAYIQRDVRIGGAVSTGSGSTFTTNAAINGAAGTARQLIFETNLVPRWVWECSATAEGGSDAGSNMYLYAKTDASATIDIPIQILRASAGTMTFGGSTSRPIVFTGSILYTGKGFTNNGATTTFTFPARTRYQYVQTTAASLATTLPGTASSLDGLVVTLVVSANVATATWVAGSGGATIVGAPAALVANTPVRFIYHHATTSWYPY